MTDDEWTELLRTVGLGAGLHEPLRTKVIEEAMKRLMPVLAAHDERVEERERLRLVNLVHDEGWGLPFDSDHDRAIVAAWIEEATP